MLHWTEFSPCQLFCSPIWPLKCYFYLLLNTPSYFFRLLFSEWKTHPHTESWPHTVHPNYRQVCFSVGRGQHRCLSLSLSVLLSSHILSVSHLFSGMVLWKTPQRFNTLLVWPDAQSNRVCSVLRWETSEGSEPCVWYQAEVPFCFTPFIRFESLNKS